MRNSSHYFYLVFSLTLLFFACKSPEEKKAQAVVDKYQDFDNASIQKVLQEDLLNSQEFRTAFTDADSLSNSLKEIYSASKGLFFIDARSGEANSLFQEALAAIESSKVDGLNPADYGFNLIQQLRNNPSEEDSTSASTLVRERAMVDLFTTASLLSQSDDLFKGKMKTSWELNPKSKNHTAALLDALKNEDLSSYFQSLQPTFPQYEKLTKALMKFKKIKQNGGLQQVSADPSLRKGKKGKAVNALINRLKQTDELSKAFANESFDDEVLKAVKTFQVNHGLPNTGNVGPQTIKALNEPIDEIIQKIELNLERMRWLPQEMGSEYVFVNIPDASLDVYENNEASDHMICVVGDPKSPTPVMAEEMTHIIMSPAWNVPISIAREEILQWVHINPNLLIVQGVTVFHKGKKVEPHSVDWKSVDKNSREYTFRVKPSSNNALGEIKFMFPNHHSVYMHDTNSKLAFKEHNRAQSAGCIRVHKPVDLAYNLLEEKEGWTKSRIKQNMGRGSERNVKLDKIVPVYLYYLTAWVNDAGQLQLRRDVYGHDRKQLKRWKDLQQSESA